MNWCIDIEVDFWASDRGHCVVMYVQFLSSIVKAYQWQARVATELALGKLKSAEDDFAHLWYDHLKESFSYGDIQFIINCLNSSTIEELREGAWKGSVATSTRAEHVG